MLLRAALTIVRRQLEKERQEGDDLRDELQHNNDEFEVLALGELLVGVLINGGEGAAREAHNSAAAGCIVGGAAG